MSAAGRSDDTPDDAAGTLGEAAFVRVVATADGDALSAAGLLARALESIGTPYQASLATVPRPPATDADCTVAVGHSSGDVVFRETPLSLSAADAVRDLAPGAVDPLLALAGTVAAGGEPAGALLEAADLDRRPGVAIPTADRSEGLAGSTLVRAAFSGDDRAAEAALADLGDDADGRNLASFVALSAVKDAPPRAAEAVERALHPYTCDRFETLGGYADVLDAVARERPGTGVALALGHEVEHAALETWRDHGRHAHAALDASEIRRYDGVNVARVDTNASLGTVARLLFEYRSPEPVGLAVSDGEAAVAAAESIESPLHEAAAALDGRSTARDGRGAATFDGPPEAFTESFREAL